MNIDYLDENTILTNNHKVLTYDVKNNNIVKVYFNGLSLIKIKKQQMKKKIIL